MCAFTNAESFFLDSNKLFIINENTQSNTVYMYDLNIFHLATVFLSVLSNNPMYFQLFF